MQFSHWLRYVEYKYLPYPINEKKKCGCWFLEEAIKRDSEKVAQAIQQNDPNVIAAKASSIARRAQRVAVVASKEAANSEDPKFVHDVSRAANQLSGGERSKGHRS